ncbi:hypothetical protein LNX36_26520, partial [Klebsiella pneumoniae]|nr:hypothetical protein [Klebsiella pneumoniae]
MEHGARQNTTRVIAVGFISLGTLLTLSLATNIIQGINNYRLQTEQKVAVTPMLFRAPFAVSQNQADASYIEQRHCCKVSDEAAFCLIQRPYISKTLLTRRISPRGSP